MKNFGLKRMYNSHAYTKFSISVPLSPLKRSGSPTLGPLSLSYSPAESPKGSWFAKSSGSLGSPPPPSGSSSPPPKGSLEGPASQSSSFSCLGPGVAALLVPRSTCLPKAASVIVSVAIVWIGTGFLACSLSKRKLAKVSPLSSLSLAILSMSVSNASGLPVS